MKLIRVAKKNEFRFSLKAKDGQIILSSEEYTSRAACINGINSVARNAADADIVDIKIKNILFYEIYRRVFLKPIKLPLPLKGLPKILNFSNSCSAGIEDCKENRLYKQPLFFRKFINLL